MQGLTIENIPQGVLRQKFRAPVLSCFHIPEDVITRSVFQLEQWRVCLLHASAGSGKTSLFTQWYADFLEDETILPLWISLDEQDRTLSRFLETLACSMQRIDERFVAFSHKNSFCNSRDSLVDLVNLIEDCCDPSIRYVLMLDNFDLASSKGVDDVVLFLNRCCSESIRFMLAGRSFSSRMYDLLLEASVLEFGPDELDFNETRLGNLARRTIPDMSDAEFANCVERFGSWPMGLTLYSLARKRTRDPKSLDHILIGYCERYFNKAVIRRITALEHEFLIEASLLDELDPLACESVLRMNQAEGLLEQFEQRGFFVRFDRVRTVYRIDAPFLWYLRSTLLALPHKQIAKLATRASEWFERQDLFHERVKYLSIACDPMFVEETILHSVNLSPSNSQNMITQYLLERPAGMFVEDSYLTWVSVWSCLSAGLVKEARAALGFAKRQNVAGQESACAYTEAIFVALEGDSQASQTAIRELLYSPDHPIPKPFTCLLIHMEGENCERLGQLAESRVLYRKALTLAERMDCSFYKLFDLYLLARQCAFLGDFETALSTIRRARSSWREDGAIYGGLNATLACMMVERNELEQAASCLEKAQKNVSLCTNIDMYLDVQIAAARYERAKGNVAESFAIVTEALDAVSDKGVPRRVDVETYAFKGSLSAELGELTAMCECESVIDQHCGSADMLRSFPCMVSKAKIASARGDYEFCIELLEVVRSRIRQSGESFGIVLVQVFILESAAYANLGDRVRATVCMIKAIELAMRGGYLGVFLEGGKYVYELILDAATSRKTSRAIREYAKKILIVFGSECEEKSALPARCDDVQGYFSLTAREKEVLGLLNNGMSKHEISAALSISQNTAKSHIRNIYSKLGIHTRSEAFRAVPSLDPSTEE